MGSMSLLSFVFFGDARPNRPASQPSQCRAFVFEMKHFLGVLSACNSASHRHIQSSLSLWWVGEDLNSLIPSPESTAEPRIDRPIHNHNRVNTKQLQMSNQLPCQSHEQRGFPLLRAVIAANFPLYEHSTKGQNGQKSTKVKSN